MAIDPEMLSYFFLFFLFGIYFVMRILNSFRQENKQKIPIWILPIAILIFIYGVITVRAIVIFLSLIPIGFLLYELYKRYKNLKKL